MRNMSMWNISQNVSKVTEFFKPWKSNNDDISLDFGTRPRFTYEALKFVILWHLTKRGTLERLRLLQPHGKCWFPVLNFFKPPPPIAYKHCSWQPTLKLGGTMTLPAGIWSTMVSPSKSQRSHWEWLASRAQGNSSTSRVFRPDFQQESFTCMGLSHWARGSSTDLWGHNEYWTESLK